MQRIARKTRRRDTLDMPFYTALDGCRRFVTQAVANAWHKWAVEHPSYHAPLTHVVVVAIACGGALPSDLPDKPAEPPSSVQTATPTTERSGTASRWSATSDTGEDFGGAGALPFASQGLGPVGLAGINLIGSASDTIGRQGEAAWPIGRMPVIPAAPGIMFARPVGGPQMPGTGVVMSLPPHPDIADISGPSTRQDVPEPATFWLLGGLLTLLGMRKKRPSKWC